VVKKDGQALSDVEQKKENEKTQKRIEELQKRETKKEAKEEKAKEEGKSEEKDEPGIEIFLRACQFVNPRRERFRGQDVLVFDFEPNSEFKAHKLVEKVVQKLAGVVWIDEKDEPGVEIFLRACQFVNPRRERFRGQDVLVFDFEPNPEFKAHKMVEKIVQKLAGVVWIDEKAHDVARLEAYFVGDMRFAGGLLANLEKGTSFVMEQAYVNNEVWLPTYEEAHVGVRVLLLKGIRVNAVTRYSDYKKFNVETLSTIAKPKGAAEAPADRPAKPQ